MFAEQLAGEIAGARTLARLDMLARLVWQGWGSGAVAENAAQSLAEAVHARKDEVRGTIIPVGIPAGRRSIFTARRAQGSPDRIRSRQRRRHLAFSGPMPPALAARFTVAELAVMRIVGDEVRAHGCCSLPIAAIAARSGTSRATVQRAVKIAAGMGLLTVQERRRQGQINQTNILRLISREWLDWLKKGRQADGWIGSQRDDPTDKSLHKYARPQHTGRMKREFGGENRKSQANGSPPGAR